MWWSRASIRSETSGHANAKNFNPSPSAHFINPFWQRLQGNTDNSTDFMAVLAMTTLSRHVCIFGMEGTGHLNKPNAVILSASRAPRKTDICSASDSSSRARG